MGQKKVFLIQFCRMASNAPKKYYMYETKKKKTILIYQKNKFLTE